MINLKPNKTAQTNGWAVLFGREDNSFRGNYMRAKIFWVGIWAAMSFMMFDVCLDKDAFGNEVIHKTNFPYIAGDTFRAFCNHVLDHSQAFNPTKVMIGDVIFVQVDLLDHFFKMFHPYIMHPYILLTHNCDDQSDDPVPAGFRSYLEDPKLAAWFTQNIDTQHPKLHALPIGIANHYYPHGNIALFDKYRACCKDKPRDKLLYMNFSIGTFVQERQFVYSKFVNKPYCTEKNGISVDAYLNDVTHHKFVLSPRGHGLDCHRTWEALLMGSYPIVKTSTLDPLFDDLPVIIITDWSEVTEEFLNQKYEEMSKKHYNFDKLFAPYWFKEIRKVQQMVRDGNTFNEMPCDVKVQSLEERARYFVQHVQRSIYYAEQGISKLDKHVLKLEGFSSSKVRHLLNNICSFYGVRYFEVGVWKGSTLVSALYGNEPLVSQAIAVDNWSEFDDDKTAAGVFYSVIQQFLRTKKLRFYDHDCFSIDKASVFTEPINVYFYDGNHDTESQRMALTYFDECLDDLFILIVDDYNWDKVQRGTKQALKQLKYTVVYEKPLMSAQMNDSTSWWNGLYVAVISKKPLNVSYENDGQVGVYEF